MSTSIKINGKQLFVTPTGVKLGSRGKVLPVGNLLGTVDKGTARKVRKSLRAAGHADKASAQRVRMS